MSSKLFGKDLKEYEDIDIDKILEGLTQEQLDDLNYELDPDSNLLPAADRVRDQTKKAPTGPFDRDALIEYLEKTSLEEPDWEQNKPFVHEIRGKVYQPKVKEQTKEEAEISTEYDDVLTAATEDELVDLAAVLDFVGMMNQTQYHNSLSGAEQVGGGFSSVAKADPLKELPDEPPNDTDVEESIDKLQSNGGLKELNLNNIKNISSEQFENLFNGLRDNKQLTSLSLAHTGLTDAKAKPLVGALKENKTLTSLNVESNFLTGQTLMALLEAVNVNKSIIEFRAANQRAVVLGVKSEMRAAELIQENNQILRVGLDLEIRSARIAVFEHLQANNDRELRQKRVGKSEDRQSSADR